MGEGALGVGLEEGGVSFTERSHHVASSSTAWEKMSLDSHAAFIS